MGYSKKLIKEMVLKKEEVHMGILSREGCADSVADIMGMSNKEIFKLLGEDFFNEPRPDYGLTDEEIDNIRREIRNEAFTDFETPSDTEREEQENRLKRLEEHQASVCKDCGAQRRKAFLSFDGYSDCHKCGSTNHSRD